MLLSTVSYQAFRVLSEHLVIPLLVGSVALARNHLEWLLLLIWGYFVVLCPFTKVEESFNVQATHDILYHNLNINNYDHLEFPGVVPRTFIGPLILSFFSLPVILPMQLLEIKKVYCLIVVRLVMACMLFYAFRRFVNAVTLVFGKLVAFWLCFIMISQFHFGFYVSRPLPNIFALFFALLVFDYLMRGHFKMAIWTATFSAVVFRCELVLLYGPIFLPVLFLRHISLKNAILHGIAAAMVSVAVTVMIDSWFWRRWLWPEGEVWYYNAILNKSSEWGTMPVYWYFVSALPRAMLLSLSLVPLGVYFDRRLAAVVGPAVVFIMAYSFLPHKELRFIIYAFPLLNLAAACACHRIALNSKKSWFWRFMLLGVFVHFFINCYATTIFGQASHGNYPGGRAMLRLHETDKEFDIAKRIHIDVFSAQTGISRFLHENPLWEYNKSEALGNNHPELLKFDYVFLGDPDKRKLHDRMKMFKDTHINADEVSGFHSIKKPELINKWPFIRSMNIIWSPQVVVMKKF